eukprot:557906-Hanusia_phi.AAC.1
MFLIPAHESGDSQSDVHFHASSLSRLALSFSTSTDKTTSFKHQRMSLQQPPNVLFWNLTSKQCQKLSSGHSELNT